MIKKKLTEIEYVTFDIETTGFYPDKDQIIEIGAVKTDSEGKKISTFHKFISLYKVNELPEVIKDLTKIDEQLLEAEGEGLDLVMESFLHYIEGSVLVAQNSKFDMSFIDSYYLERQIFLPNLVLDTIDLGKYLFPQKQSYKLGLLMEYFEIQYDPNAHHRADYDAEITSEILIKGLKSIYEENNVLELVGYSQIFRLEEASISQKRYLFRLLKENKITVTSKCFLTKTNAMRQISILKEFSETI